MNLFNDLVFDKESHQYWLDNKRIPSMTTTIKKLYNPFNIEGASKNVAFKQKTEQSLVKSHWSTNNTVALMRGHDTHDFAELQVDTDIQLQQLTALKKSALQYLQNIPSHYRIVDREIRMYTRLYWIAGTADLLIYDKLKDYYIIVDYKTNKDIYKNYSDYMLYPFDDYINSPFNHYIVQLNGYQIMLEEKGLHVGERHLIWLSKRSNSALFTKVNLPDITVKLRKYYSNVR